MAAAGLMLFSACGTYTEGISVSASSWAASAAWKWQETDHFLLRGRARLQGENQVFSGPFIVWASKSEGAVRADFCGPDGSPLVSFLADSSGSLFYYPDRSEAFFSPGGIPLETGYFTVNALISLIRTGFPAVPVHWALTETCDTLGTSLSWFFTSTGMDSLSVVLDRGSLFPVVSTGDTRLEATATSWHDEFNAWPLEWLLTSPSLQVILRIRSIDTDTRPPESAWTLTVPVPVDTVLQLNGEWTLAEALPIR